jgi:hypothetical protein
MLARSKRGTAKRFSSTVDYEAGARGHLRLEPATSSLGIWHSRSGSFSLPVSEDDLVFVLLENPFVQRVHR